MTHLRKMMLEELERRNYAQTTRDCYIQTIEDFARYFKRPARRHDGRVDGKGQQRTVREFSLRIGGCYGQY